MHKVGVMTMLTLCYLLNNAESEEGRILHLESTLKTNAHTRFVSHQGAPGIMPDPPTFRISRQPALKAPNWDYYLYASIRCDSEGDNCMPYIASIDLGITGIISRLIQHTDLRPSGFLGVERFEFKPLLIQDISGDGVPELAVQYQIEFLPKQQSESGSTQEGYVAFVNLSNLQKIWEGNTARCGGSDSICCSSVFRQKALNEIIIERTCNLRACLEKPNRSECAKSLSISGKTLCWLNGTLSEDNCAGIQPQPAQPQPAQPQPAQPQPTQPQPTNLGKWIEEHEFLIISSLSSAVLLGLIAALILLLRKRRS